MKVVILGSGTSQGVPIIGCSCTTCVSENPKDKRLRVSCYIETNNSRILIDTSPDFRQQMLLNKITDIDAVIYTHYHIDHIIGLDDIRQINQLNNKAVEIYANQDTMDRIKQTFSYAFDSNTYTGGGIPLLKPFTITSEKFYINSDEILPIVYHHGPVNVFGYRIGDFAYMTDCNRIPESQYDKLKNLKVLVLDALRWRPHPTHFSIDEAIAEAGKIGALKTYFTHITHDVLHDEVNSRLPEGIELAYDGLVIEL
jgi:phosphoribosyl 1,2-cyclic phosphate phosphodiesterase